MMDLQTGKLELIQEFLKLQNEEDFKPILLEEYNKRIDNSEEDFKNGRYKSSADLLTKYK